MQPAGFLKRVLALVYDSLLIGAIVLVLSLLLVFVNGGTQNLAHLYLLYNSLF